jgi:rubrerythrin
LVSALAANAWARRFLIETEAAVRFGELAHRLWQAGAASPLIELAERASGDERRHAAHCAHYVREFGGEVPPPVSRVVEYAPGHLTPDQRLAYEVVAQSCVAETQSTATLVTLLDAARDARLKSVLQELARDEVQHARLGWAYLAWAQSRLDLHFLEPLLPGMISGSAGPEIFSDGPPEAEDERLLRAGVIPRSRRRRLYLETLESVVLPGFETHGIRTAPVRDWLATQPQPPPPPQAEA